jgi:hypothetical protein
MPRPRSFNGLVHPSRSEEEPLDDSSISLDDLKRKTVFEHGAI